MSSPGEDRPDERGLDERGEGSARSSSFVESGAEALRSDRLWCWFFLTCGVASWVGVFFLGVRAAIAVVGIYLLLLSGGRWLIEDLSTRDSEDDGHDGIGAGRMGPDDSQEE